MKYETVHSWEKCVTVVWQDGFKLLWVLFTFPEKNNDQTLFSSDIALILDQRINSIQVLLTVHMFIEVTHKYVHEGFVTGEQVTQRQLQPPAKPTPAQMMPRTICIPEVPCMACGKLDLLESLFSIVMITASWPRGYPSEFYKAWVVYFLACIGVVYFLNFRFLHSVLKNDFTVKMVTLILFVTEQKRHKSASYQIDWWGLQISKASFVCHLVTFLAFGLVKPNSLLKMPVTKDVRSDMVGQRQRAVNGIKICMG